MKRLLSHVNTKVELTQFFARKTLEKGSHSGNDVVVAWGSQCKATHKDVAYLESSQEEADTKLLLHAIDATTSGATSIDIISPDTDVFVLALRRFPELSEYILCDRERAAPSQDTPSSHCSSSPTC